MHGHSRPFACGASRLAGWLLVATTLGTACGGDSQQINDASQLKAYGDEGELCLWPASADEYASEDQRTFVAGESLSVAVAMGDCFSSSCSEDNQASCTVQLVDATTLRVTSQGSYRDTEASHQMCTADCGILTARCATPPLVAGTYTVILGNEHLSVTIPSTTPDTPCVGTRTSPCMPSSINLRTFPEIENYSMAYAADSGRRVVFVGADGGCTAVCSEYFPPVANHYCKSILATAVSEGTCTVRIEMEDRSAYESQVRIERYAAGSPCTGLYPQQESPFVLVVDAGAPDAAAADTGATDAAPSLGPDASADAAQSLGPDASADAQADLPTGTCHIDADPSILAHYRCLSTGSWQPLRIAVQCVAGNPAAFPCDTPCTMTVVPEQTQTCPAGTRCLDPSEYLRAGAGSFDAGAVCVPDADAQVVDAAAGP